MGPPEVNPGMPQQEIDAMHLDPDVHQVQRAEPVGKVAQPEAAMAELEHKHREQEIDLLAQISNLDSRARSYEERINGLVSTNTKLHKALCS
jgi:hypothetical protein